MFCRHCGDLITETRCRKCGGSAVAPVVAWKSTDKDRWSKTYISKEASSQPRSISPTKRFPRPLSTSSSLSSRVSAHIAKSQHGRPPSPVKTASIIAAPEKDILPSPVDGGSLSKVYGSVLQPKETLNSYSCSICSTVFPPDAILYPDPLGTPSSSSPRFLCRLCFTANGGTKGTCPTCSRPVLALKSEGPFVETGGSFWHKRCFNCDGCSKNIGDSPMVDLLGRPSCAACFESCLSRRTPKKSTPSPISNIGGMSIGSRSREGSPAIEELELRLGLMKMSPSQQSPSPMEGTKSPRLLDRGSPSPMTRNNRDGPPLSPSAAKKPFRGGIFSSPSSPVPSLSRSCTPDLISDVSDTATQSSGPDSPPGNPESRRYSNSHTQADYTPHNKERHTHLQSDTPPSLSTSCAKCRGRIFTGKASTSFVTVPDDVHPDRTKTFHAECFRCSVCDNVLAKSGKTLNSYVMDNQGPCHPECATPVQKTKLTRMMAEAPPIVSSTASRRFDRPPEPPIFPKSLGSGQCPGCRKHVFPMDRGVVSGPQGTKWHASCLVCGGNSGRQGGDPKRKGVPGCGKKCDTNARRDKDIDGLVWCLECSLLLPSEKRASPQASPTRPTSGPMPPQYTGTTLARQFTGMGTAEGVLLRQMTGGGLSPTRSLSPTKQIGTRPRPRSVMSVRSTGK